MTDLSTTPTAEIVARVLDLHEKATPGPWAFEQTGQKCNDICIGVVAALDDHGNVFKFLEGCIESYDEDGNERSLDFQPVAAIDDTTGSRPVQDAALIAYYRTACVELAKRCLHAEAVAAKSREEALEEAAKWHDLKVADADSVQAIANTSVGMVASLMHEIHEESAAALRALKSSRTDSGRSPATNTDESGRASALNAPLTDANAPTSDK